MILASGPLHVRAADVPAPQVQTVRVAVQETLDPGFYAETFGPTMLYLRTLFPRVRFVSSFHSLDDLLQVIRTDDVDLFFSDSGIFGYAGSKYGATQIAARTAPSGSDPRAARAAAVVVRNESALRKLEDLRGRTVISDDPNSASTWLLFLSLMTERGVRREATEENAVFTRFEFPGPLELLAAGKGDAAVVPACELERLEAAGQIRVGTMRVLEASTDGPLACRRTGPLLPGVILGATRRLTPDFLKTLTVASLTMPPSSDGSVWSIVNDFSKIDAVYRTLGAAFNRRPSRSPSGITLP